VVRLDRSVIAPLDVMQRYLDAAMRGDWDTAFGFFADDIALHIPGRSEFAGEHRGKQVAIDYIRTAQARSEGAEVELELIDMLASEERVALLVRERFHREDGVVNIRRANVYRVQGEQIVEIRIFEADQYGVDELLS
jgi:ketosteroid isomerase-like protein